MFLDPEGTFDREDDEATGPWGPEGEEMDEVGQPFAWGEELEDDYAERN